MSLPFDPKVQSALDQHELFHARKLLEEVEQILFCIVENAQTREEAKEGFSSQFKNELGEHICVPEDAAPNCDAARSCVHDAVDEIDLALTNREWDHES